MNNLQKKEVFILFLCLLVGFSLRFYTFDQKSLWIDEVHTFNDSRDDFKSQMKFYKENPSYLHPPLFFILTHFFHPFTKPERDLRIIPLIFGTLCIPMIYLLARQFSPLISLPCVLSLTFMTYHISLSQDARSYSLLMFLGMAGLYFFIKHLTTSKRRYLLPMALFFSVLLYISYSSIPFIVLSQILWLYRPSEKVKKPALSSVLTLNGLILLFCLPWIIFLATNYKGQDLMDPLHGNPGSFLNIVFNIVHDWTSLFPLTVGSVILLILLPVLSKFRKNAIVLLAVLALPIGGVYVFCKLLSVAHFVTSRYFINFLPLFFIAVYLSLEAVELKFEGLKRFLRLKVLFVIFFIISNLIILPLYYRSGKQDFRGMVTYLMGQLKEGDKIFVQSIAYIPGMLHYFRIIPTGRHYTIPFGWKDSEREIESSKEFVYGDKTYTINSSNSCCAHYIADGSRLWIVHGKPGAKEFRRRSPIVLKAYFDGSFASFRKFPEDASMYLFLWDPKSPEEKGIEVPIE